MNEPRLQGTVFWQETFGKPGYNRMRGCLRVSWGDGDKQGIGVLVEITRNGKIFGNGPNPDQFEADISLELPAESRGKPHSFWLFVFGSPEWSVREQNATCTEEMSRPSYRCQQSEPATCLFSWVFRPKSLGGDVQAAPIPGDPDATCRLILRSFLSETVGENPPELTNDAGPTDKTTPPKDQAPSEQKTETQPRDHSTSDRTAEPPVDSTPIPDILPEKPAETPMTPDSAGKDQGSPDGFSSLGGLIWCKTDMSGTPVQNGSFQACDSKQVCKVSLCIPKCRLFPPIPCPNGLNCSPGGEFCFSLCSSKDDFSFNYDPKCPLGMVCEGAFYNPSSAFGNVDHCAPSEFYDGYATGTKVLGEACSKADGCDGTKGVFCALDKGKTTGSCAQACDPRPNATITCPSGKSCVEEVKSFLQGKCQ